MTMTTRVAVDVGGTFTDLIFHEGESGEVRVNKGPSDPSALEAGILNVVLGALSDQDLAKAGYFLHGMTVALNALLERKGATVGLLTTSGFRDTLELRRGERAVMNDLRWRPAPPLVPRQLRHEVDERVMADGSVLRPLASADVERALAEFRRLDVTSIAIVFINAYVNPEHELSAEAVLRQAGFAGDISVSHRVTGEYREYERTSTTVVDAYVRPKVSNYLSRLDRDLRRAGFRGQILLTHSGGGLIPIEVARERPFETIMSGPVAGAMGAARLCQLLEIDCAIAADVGGTSFDASLIIDGNPQVKYEGQVIGMPLQTPWVDVRSIGAGGGSIAYVDEVGGLQVGPESSGAVPGPCCYGRGGTEPTVTDAAGVLGMLGPGELSAGLNLDFELSRRALAALGQRLELGVDEAAEGVMKVVTAHMATAIRSLTIEQGRDPRDAQLIAFGGAGPLFGCLLLSELNLPSVVIPQHAGNFSAWGLLAQDVTRSLATTFVHPLDPPGLAAAEAILETLYARLAERTYEYAGAMELREPALDLRYQGQEYTLTIRFEPNGTGEGDAGLLRSRFEEEYRRSFSHTLGSAVEIVNVRANLRAMLPKDFRPTIFEGVNSGRASIEAYSHNARSRMAFAVVDRASLTANVELAGPAIVCEPTATTYLDAGFKLQVHPTGVLVIEPEPTGGRKQHRRRHAARGGRR